jgi:hypothetical protein
MGETMIIDPSGSKNDQDGITESGFQRRRWYNQRDFKFIATVVIFVVLFQGYGFFDIPFSSLHLSVLKKIQCRIIPHTN